MKRKSRHRERNKNAKRIEGDTTMQKDHLMLLRLWLVMLVPLIMLMPRRDLLGWHHWRVSLACRGTGACRRASPTWRACWVSCRPLISMTEPTHVACRCTQLRAVQPLRHHQGSWDSVAPSCPPDPRYPVQGGRPAPTGGSRTKWAGSTHTGGSGDTHRWDAAGKSPLPPPPRSAMGTTNSSETEHARSGGRAIVRLVIVVFCTGGKI